MRVTDLIDQSKLKCWECQGKPDYLYFVDTDLEILSIICEECRDSAEATIRAIGAAFSVSIIPDIVKSD